MENTKTNKWTIDRYTRTGIAQDVRLSFDSEEDMNNYIKDNKEKSLLSGINFWYIRAKNNKQDLQDFVKVFNEMKQETNTAYGRNKEKVSILKTHKSKIVYYSEKDFIIRIGEMNVLVPIKAVHTLNLSNDFIFIEIVPDFFYLREHGKDFICFKGKKLIKYFKQLESNKNWYNVDTFKLKNIII